MTVQNRFDLNEQAVSIELMKAEYGLPEIKKVSEIQEVLDNISSLKSLKTLDVETIVEYSVMLSSYSLYLTYQENRLKSVITWCESNLKHIVGRECRNIEGYFSEKEAYIRASEKEAVEISKLKHEMESKLEYIKFLSAKFQHLSETLKNLSFTKRGRND